MEIIKSSMKLGKGQRGVRKGVERMGRENKKNKSEEAEESHCTSQLYFRNTGKFSW